MSSVNFGPYIPYPVVHRRGDGFDLGGFSDHLHMGLARLGTL